MLSIIPNMLDSKLACDRLDKYTMQVQGLYMRLYTRNAPNSKCLGQQNCMRLIANVRV